MTSSKEKGRDEGSILYQRYLFPSFTSIIAASTFAVFLPIVAYRSGANAVEIGLVGGVQQAVYVIGSFLVARLSSRDKTRGPLILASLSVLFTMSLCYSVISSPTTLILLRLVEGIGWSMMWPTVQVGLRRDLNN